MTSDGLRHLHDLRRSLPEPPRQLRLRKATNLPACEHPENIGAIA
jgi:hypothetical protein